MTDIETSTILVLFFNLSLLILVTVKMLIQFFMFAVSFPAIAPALAKHFICSSPSRFLYETDQSLFYQT